MVVEVLTGFQVELINFKKIWLIFALRLIQVLYSKVMHNYQNFLRLLDFRLYCLGQELLRRSNFGRIYI